MTTFKIIFYDIDSNDVYSVTKKFDNNAEATHYANLILANTSDECVTFSVIEL
jgi:hypothetical protein